MKVRQAGVEEQLTWAGFEARVRAGRVAPNAEVFIPAITGDRWVTASSLELYHSLRRTDERDYQRRISTGGPPLLTALLVGVQIQLWWYSHLPWVDVAPLLKASPPIFEDGEAWRLLTMAFTQVEIGHLSGNLLFLALAGFALETALGWRNLLTIYLASALGGSIASLWLSPWTSSLGSSGAVLGCLAACTVFGLRYPALMPERLRSLYGLAVLPFLGITTISGLFNDVTDNYCHVGGLVTGAIVAAVVDPEGLERRVGYNRALRFGLAAAAAIVLATPAALGARIEPLFDASYARWASVEPGLRRDATPPEPATDGLSFVVPAGWAPTRTLGGEPGFASPSRHHRALAVVEGTSPRPISPASLVDARLLTLRQQFPTLVTGPARPTTFVGRDALAWEATVPGRSLRFVGIATHRGVQSLEAYWEGAPDDRVDPERLFAGIQWNTPEALRRARDAVHATPRGRAARAALAAALDDVGEASEAVDLWRALVTELPEDDAGWEGLLRCVERYPDTVREPTSVLADALTRNPTARVIVAVSSALSATGSPEAAAGLIDLAWGQMPGDRTIARARLPEWNDLDPSTSLPVDVSHDPITGEPRTDAAKRTLTTLPMTLENAALRGAERRRETEALADAAATAIDGDDPYPALFRLRRRHTARPEELALERIRIRTDLLRVADGEIVAWLAGPPLAAVRARRAREPGWPPDMPPTSGGDQNPQP